MWLLACGFLLVAFPTAFQAFIQTPGNLKGNWQAINTATASASAQNLGPIRIDSLLHGKQEPSQPPLRVVIPALSVDLPVVEARVVDGFWEISETTASHGIGSANPGEIGNTVLFAHARNELFGPLRNLKKGAVIYVMSKDRWFRYQVTETTLVNPDDIQVIAPTSNETLTLFTCSGFLDSKRLIVTATPLRP